MHEITASAIGTIVTEVRHSITPAGISVARFRMVSQPRRFDSNAGSFVDLEASFLSVTAWRAMADHVAVSLRKGDPILVIGRLRVREWEQEGRTRTSVEIDARSVGHDLARGSSRFARRVRPVEEGAGRARDAGPAESDAGAVAEPEGEAAAAVA
ncbi:MAG: single-stranded DNA-binding protein [Actinobacteria bacterium]|nr:MAG: single-stranded DNA-binding protein [Actinomycetota bacterium]